MQDPSIGCERRVSPPPSKGRQCDARPFELRTTNNRMLRIHGWHWSNDGVDGGLHFSKEGIYSLRKYVSAITLHYVCRSNVQDKRAEPTGLIQKLLYKFSLA